MAAFFFLPQLRAVIFFATADPNYNATAPTGRLVGSGWQWVGNWRGFQGVPVGPHHFLTAHHVDGAVGDPLVLNGVSYATVAMFDDSMSDLRLWQISGTFPAWAPLYRAGDEIGKSFVVFGRGLTRGAEVRDLDSNSLRGWQWGAGDGRLRWGENTFRSSVNRGAYWGELLYATFDATGGVNEAHLALGDSSGPVFIHEPTGWKLAGIAAAVDALFNTTEVGTGFNAAIFDARGLYYGSSGKWTRVPARSASPSGFYVTRVSARTAWIDQVIDAPIPPPSPGLAVKSVEEQTDSNSSPGWRPPQRYKMILMLAALGNAAEQFELGTALLQEPDDDARTEGIKWLKAAAASGYGDAVALLEQSREQLVRPDRDRDKVRLSRCCPIPGR